MKEKESHFPVVLAKEACPLCGKPQDGPILIGRTTVTTENNKIEKLQGQVIGIMKEPCNECKELMKKGFLLIGVVEKKTEDRKNPYRSGNIWVMKMGKAKKIFNEEIMKGGAAFIDVNIAEMIGLPDINFNA